MERKERPATFSSNERWFIAKLGADVWNHVVLEFLLPANRTQFKKAFFITVSAPEMWHIITDSHYLYFSETYPDFDRSRDLRRVITIKGAEHLTALCCKYSQLYTKEEYAAHLNKGAPGVWRKVDGKWMQRPSQFGVPHWKQPWSETFHRLGLRL